MVRTVAAKARHAIVTAAQRSAESIKTVAGDAVGAAAQAAAGVVLDSTAKALEAGRTKITRSGPAVEKKVGRAAKRTVSGRRRKRTTRKRAAGRTRTGRARTQKRAVRGNAAKRKAKRRSH